jgi:DNA invertase Pin-like site-specific DNA recombinase
MPTECNAKPLEFAPVAARRPELERVLDELEAGDVLVVTKLDRLARSTLDLLRMVDQIGREGLASRALAIHGPTPRRRPAGSC